MSVDATICVKLKDGSIMCGYRPDKCFPKDLIPYLVTKYNTYAKASSIVNGKTVSKRLNITKINTLESEDIERWYPGDYIYLFKMASGMLDGLILMQMVIVFIINLNL